MDRTGRRRSEAGQILIIVAGSVGALLLLLGLVFDGGIAVFNRRDAQNIADIAALAGTHEVADWHTGKNASPNVQAAVASAATANGCDPLGNVPCVWRAYYVGAGATGPQDVGSVGAGSPPSSALGVRVEVDRRPATFLARLALIDHWNVSTQATAIAWEPRMAPSANLLPIAFKQDPTGYEPGQVYDLTDGKDAPGGFGFISWDGSNDAGALAESLCEPNNPEFYLPKVFSADPGKTNANDVRACLEDWIYDETDATDTEETVLIPIYDTITGTGNNTKYNIVGIAAFRIVSQGQPAVDNIRGYFEGIYPFTDPVPGSGGTQPPTAGSTSFSLSLVR
jgi:Flp pilus assembly protein TadG